MDFSDLLSGVGDYLNSNKDNIGNAMLGAGLGYLGSGGNLGGALAGGLGGYNFSGISDTLGSMFGGGGTGTQFPINPSMGAGSSFTGQNTTNPLGSSFTDPVTGMSNTGGMNLNNPNINNFSDRQLLMGTGPNAEGAESVSGGGNSMLDTLMGGGRGVLDFARQNPQAVKSMFNIVSGLQQQRALQQAMGRYQGQADLYQQYGNQLNNLVANPSSIQSNPAYQGLLKASEQATQRQMAAEGYSGSGNILNAVAANAQNQAMQFYNQEANRLAQLQQQYGPYAQAVNRAQQAMQANQQQMLSNILANSGLL